MFFFVQITHKSPFLKVVYEIRRTILIIRCKYYFFTHRNFSRTTSKKGQVYFNLTHGTPLKDSTGRHNSIKKSAYLLTTSQFVGKLRVKTYKGGENKLQILGFPRNDLLFKSEDILRLFNIYRCDYQKIVMWMPTFRRHINSSTNDAGAKADELDIPIIMNLKNWGGLNEFLIKNKVLLIVKPQPAQDLKFFKVESNSNIHIITNDDLFERNVELYSLLSESDALITDYSSVFMDYLLTNRPIAFTIDDLQKYQKNLGFLVDNPLEYMPGYKIENFKHMLSFIESLLNGEDDYTKQRYEIMRLFNFYQDNKSADRILKFLNLI